MSDPFGANEITESLRDDPPRDRVAQLRKRPLLALAIVAVVLVVVSLVAKTCAGSSDTAAELVNKGLAAQRANDNVKARDLYRKAAKKDPRNKFAHYNLGLIAQTVDNDALTAETEYDAALAIDNGFAPALFNLGILRANAKRTAEAIDLYRRAVASDDTFAAAHFNLGLLLREQDPSSEEATNEINRGIELDASLESRLPTTTTTGR